MFDQSLEELTTQLKNSAYMGDERHTVRILTEGEGYSIVSLNHSPVLPGTMTGAVHWSQLGKSMTTFIIDEYGHIACEPSGDVRVADCVIDLEKGELKLVWECKGLANCHAPCENGYCNTEVEIAVSYEYSTAEKEYVPKDIEPTTIGSWVWDSTMSETMGDKIEAIRIKIIEMTNIQVKKGIKGYFWLHTSPVMSSILEQASSFKGVGHRPTGIKHAVGILANRWEVVSDPEMPDNVMYIRCRWGGEENLKVAKLTTVNLKL